MLQNRLFNIPHQKRLFSLYLTPEFSKESQTNPTILLKEGENRERKIEEIFSTDVPFLFVQAIGSAFNNLCEDAYRIYSLAPEGKKLELRFH